MKFRPLCIDYHADAVSLLQEDVRVVPQVVIYPVNDVVDSSESESEEDVQREKRTVPPPPRFKAFKRSLSPLKDDASFECMKQDTLKDMDCDQNESDERSLLTRGDYESEDDEQRKCLPLSRSKHSKRSLLPVEDDTSFDYMNHETLQDTDDEIDRHPLQDTDDELDPLHDTEDEMDRDVGKSGKRLLSTRRPIVDVRVMPSYRHEAFSQHSQIDGGGNQSKRAKRLSLIHI